MSFSSLPGQPLTPLPSPPRSSGIPTPSSLRKQPSRGGAASDSDFADDNGSEDTDLDAEDVILAGTDDEAPVNSETARETRSSSMIPSNSNSGIPSTTTATTGGESRTWTGQTRGKNNQKHVGGQGDRSRAQSGPGGNSMGGRSMGQVDTALDKLLDKDYPGRLQYDPFMEQIIQSRNSNTA